MPQAPAGPFGVVCAFLRAAVPAASVPAGAFGVPVPAVSPGFVAPAPSAFAPYSVPALGFSIPVGAARVMPTWDI